MFGYGYFFSKTDSMFFLVVILPILVISLLVSLKLKMTYNKYSKIKNINNVSGAVVARNILDSYGLYEVKVEAVSGHLSDHYDPTCGVVRLSYKNYEGSSIAAIGVAAHEVGHAIQHAKGYFPIKIRSAVIPMTQIGSMASVPIFFAGLILSNLKIAYFGIILFAFVAFFQFITLPVEFDASARAIKIIGSQNILSKEEVKGVKKVLWAAAMTYVVSFAMTLAQIVRLLLILFNAKNDD